MVCHLVMMVKDSRMQLKLTIKRLLTNEAKEKCNTCVYYVNCAYRLASDKFILQCDDYEDVAEIRMVDPDVENLSANVKGLCSNCAKAAECRLPKAITGVWHCEEYE
jgi:hypothetical protein